MLTAGLAATTPIINSNGIVEWCVTNVIPIILLIIGISIIGGSAKDSYPTTREPSPTSSSACA